VKDVLADVKKKLCNGAYKNEEHVRLCLVARILLELGWNIWDPSQVDAEFRPVPSEDNTRVDLALFAKPGSPSAFVEIKAVGKMDIGSTEVQLRNYNRDNTALFSIMTDGLIWRFYYPRSGGPFPDKCFKVIDLRNDSEDEILTAFETFLNKENILNGEAEKQANKRLKLTQRQKAMEGVLPEARNLTLNPPFPSLPQAIVEMLEKRGQHVSVDEASNFLTTFSTPASSVAPSVTLSVTPSVPTFTPSVPPAVMKHEQFNPDTPPSLRHTKVIKAFFGKEPASNWNHLVKIGVQKAYVQGLDCHRILASVGGSIRDGHHAVDGYSPVENTNLSIQGRDADDCWRRARELARTLNQRLFVHFQWREKQGAAHPGGSGCLEWNP